MNTTDKINQLPDGETFSLMTVDELIALLGEMSEINTKLEDTNTALAADLERKTRALEMIAGRRQCIDNLMSDKDIAQAALKG